MRMPFGKFTGVELADLPDGYVEWLGRLDLREPLAAAVAKEYETRFTKTVTSDALSAAAQTMAQEIISAGFRKLARQYHPDTGGDTQAMTLVNQAADFLRQTVRDHACD